MGASGQNCPRCAQPLARSEQGKVALEACTKCKGMLVAQVALAKLLAALSGELLKSFDPDAKIDKLPSPPGRIGCPNCAKPMQSDDYCAAGIVTFDRCESCGLLWLDPNELGAMTLMWARMEGLRFRRENQFEQMQPYGTPGYGGGGSLGTAVASIVFDFLF